MLYIAIYDKHHNRLRGCVCRERHTYMVYAYCLACKYSHPAMQGCVRYKKHTSEVISRDLFTTWVRWFPERTHRILRNREPMCTFEKSPHPYVYVTYTKRTHHKMRNRKSMFTFGKSPHPHTFCNPRRKDHASLLWEGCKFLKRATSARQAQ